MSKITYENKKGKITITNRISHPETVNEHINNAIATGMFKGVLPMTIIPKKKETRIECSVQGFIPVTKYFSGIISKKMFLDFVHEIAMQIKNCEKNKVNVNNLDLQNDRIFIDPRTKSVKCIYWPVVNNQNEKPPHLYLKQLPYELTFNPLEDEDYVETYKAFFNSGQPFSVNSFDKMILMLLGKKTTGNHAAPSEILSGTLEHEEKFLKQQATEKKIAAIEYDPFAYSSGFTEESYVKKEKAHDDNFICCQLCGTHNLSESSFCIKCGTNLKKNVSSVGNNLKDNNRIESHAPVLGNRAKGTVVLGHDDPKMLIRPILIRLKTKETFLVDKPVFQIGTDRVNCNLYINDNKYISRNHADIIEKSGKYYIIDHNSKNKTYLDGKPIPAEVEIQLVSGMKIRLANEELIFKIEA